jgi:hypothetical protein
MLFFRVTRFLCKCFSGGMDKAYKADSDKVLRETYSKTQELSKSQIKEIEKHQNIFTKSKKISSFWH